MCRDFLTILVWFNELHLDKVQSSAEFYGLRVTGESPSLPGAQTLLSNGVAVFQQGGSLIRSQRSERSTHTVKWVQVVYFFFPHSVSCQAEGRSGICQSHDLYFQTDQLCWFLHCVEIVLNTQLCDNGNFSVFP